MSMNVIKPDVGSGLIVQRSYLFQPAPYRPAAVSSAARRNIVINPSIRYLSRRGGTKGGALPLMLLLAACGGGGGGGDTPPVITTSRQSASAAPTPPEDTQQKEVSQSASPPEDTQQKEVSPPEDTPTERAPPQQEEISPSILPLREPPPKEPGREVSGDLYDPPIIGAKVYVDVNRNRRVDGKDHRDWNR